MKQLFIGAVAVSASAITFSCGINVVDNTGLYFAINIPIIIATVAIAELIS